MSDSIFTETAFAKYPWYQVSGIQYQISRNKSILRRHIYGCLIFGRCPQALSCPRGAAQGCCSDQLPAERHPLWGFSLLFVLFFCSRDWYLNSSVYLVQWWIFYSLQQILCETPNSCHTMNIPSKGTDRLREANKISAETEALVEWPHCWVTILSERPTVERLRCAWHSASTLPPKKIEAHTHTRTCLELLFELWSWNASYVQKQRQ